MGEWRNIANDSTRLRAACVGGAALGGVDKVFGGDDSGGQGGRRGFVRCYFEQNEGALWCCWCRSGHEGVTSGSVSGMAAGMKEAGGELSRARGWPAA